VLTPTLVVLLSAGRPRPRPLGPGETSDTLDTPALRGFLAGDVAPGLYPEQSLGRAMILYGPTPTRFAFE
jgi:hypothetical protein